MCCGKKRAQARKTAKTKQVSETQDKPVQNSLPKINPTPYFQYLGETELIVIGPKTGKRYRFDRPGSVVAVNPRDMSSMAAVSILRRVEQ